MYSKITTIPLVLPLKMGSVNCYLIETNRRFFLVDTGPPNRHEALERELESCGCRPGDLKLILITHGDFDHIGNATFLRSKYGAQIAMHLEDAGMAERGDMFYNRRKGYRVLNWLSSTLFGFGESKRFRPDMLIDESTDLSAHGLDAQVLSIPGHSLGSIGILFPDGELFCGDLLENTNQPAINSIIDDLDTARVSLERLKGLGVQTVYPGHGSSFLLSEMA
jgi:hydroxyacylglutathione hydrolase